MYRLLSYVFLCPSCDTVLSNRVPIWNMLALGSKFSPHFVFCKNRWDTEHLAFMLSMMLTFASGRHGGNTAGGGGFSWTLVHHLLPLISDAWSIKGVRARWGCRWRLDRWCSFSPSHIPRACSPLVTCSPASPDDHCAMVFPTEHYPPEASCLHLCPTYFRVSSPNVNSPAPWRFVSCLFHNHRSTLARGTQQTFQIPVVSSEF